MSAIATMIKMPKSALDGLRIASTPKKSVFGKPKDIYNEYLERNGKIIVNYKWSGYYLGTLLCYLQEHDIDLMKSEYIELSSFITQSRNVTHFILTIEQKRICLEKLAIGFDEKQLRGYFNEFNQADEPEAGKYMMDGIKALQKGLEAIDEESVIILIIG